MPVRLDGAGRESGGGPFSRGHLYKLLANPIYTGHLAHKGRTFPGQHAAIVEESTFAAVGAQLGANTQARRRARSSSEALLMGRLRDDRGEAMSPSSAAKGGARYRYYTSQALLQGRKAEAGSVARVPAPEIEGVVLDVVQALAGPEPDGSGREYAADRMECWVEAVTVRKGAVEIRLTPEGASRTGTPTLIVPWSPPRTTRSRAVIGPAEGGAAPCRAMPSDVRRTLLVSVAKARSWMGWLASGEAADAEASRGPGWPSCPRRSRAPHEPAPDHSRKLR